MPRTAPNFRDLSGSIFGRLRAMSVAERARGKVKWLCVCQCGNECTVVSSNLTLGHQLSCGCLNAEKRAERNDARRTTDEHKREIAKIRSLRWAKNNRNRTKEKYLKDKRDPVKWAAILASAREWNRRNQERKRVWTRNRRSKLKAGGTHTVEDIRSLIDLQKRKCAICRCGISAAYHVDHIIPLSRGGSNTRSNLQLLCAACNLGKWAHDPIDYMRSIGLLL